MILLQQHTSSLIGRAVSGSAHALLFTGPDGAGKTFAGRHFATQKLGLNSMSDLDKQAYFRTISPDNNVIGIEQIRALQKFLQLKTPGTAPVRRIVIIEHAHLMTTEAQNALLKSLEEPPADTVVILTAPHTLRLKETIYSRVQQIPVQPVSKAQAVEHFGSMFSPDQVERAFAISGGNAGLLTALLHDQDHVLKSYIQTAKDILSLDMFGRLTKVDELSRQKDQLPMFLQACKLICNGALQQAAAKQKQLQVKQWHRRLEAVYRAEAASARNPNAKLLLTDLLLNI